MLTVEDKKLAVARLGDLEEAYCNNPYDQTVWYELKSLRSVMEDCLADDK